MIQRLSLLLLALMSVCGCESAPPVNADKTAVLATVQALFDAMHSGDREAAARTVLPDGVFVVTFVKDGKRVERVVAIREWLEKLPRDPAVLLEEFVGRPTVLVDGDVAVVWGTYSLRVDGKLSHTGVDAFNLVRTDTGWRICGAAYSMIRPAAPPPVTSGNHPR